MKRLRSLLAFVLAATILAGCGDTGSSKVTTGEAAPGKVDKSGGAAPAMPPPPPLPGK